MSTPAARGRIVVLLVVLTLAGFALLVVTAPPGPKDVPAAPQSLVDSPVFAANVQSPPPPFYSAPDPLPDRLPGRILRTQAIEDAPAGMKATRIMYLSTGADGEPTAVTGMIVEPAGPLPRAGRPVVGFAHGTTGIGRECSISQQPFTPGSAGASMFNPRIRTLVEEGYIVAATDYEGEGARGKPTYLVKSTEAYNVLDSIRAVINLQPQLVDVSRVAITGHSQGGHAALSAASLAPEYAPELQLRGVIASAPGLLPPLPLAIQALVANPGNPKEASVRAAYVLNIVSSWSATFPDQLEPSEILTPEGIAALPLAEKYCYGNLAPRLTKPFTTYVKSDPSVEIVRLISENMPVDRRIDIPVLLLQGMEDTDVSPPLTVAAAKTLCQLGTTVELVTTANDAHETLTWTEIPTSMEWLSARFDGAPAPSTCGGLT